MTISKNLVVFKSLNEDSNVGWIWLPPIDNKIKSRDFVKLTVNRSSIICVVRIIDNNFKVHYNKSDTNKINDSNNVVVISDYYRDKLGTQAGQQYDFKITQIKYNFISKIRALLQHPDNITKVAVLLALVSILVTMFGVIYSVFQ